jgi:hypothetical protein
VVWSFFAIAALTTVAEAECKPVNAGAIDFATGKVATLITWVDGTGKFAGASGQIRVMADVQLDGTVVSDYRGELCTP